MKPWRVTPVAVSRRGHCLAGIEGTQGATRANSNQPPLDSFFQRNYPSSFDLETRKAF